MLFLAPDGQRVVPRGSQSNLASPDAVQHDKEGAQDDQNVQAQGAMVDISEVEQELALP